MPLLKLKLAVKKCQSGDNISLLVSDPASSIDVRRWANKMGYIVDTVKIDQTQTQIFVQI
nr:sulfurtransferase TusA family protein [Saccharobesus litoralis]